MKENLHLTMAFLGEVEEENINAVHTILGSIVFQPFSISLNRIQTFQTGNSQTVLLGAEQSQKLSAIYKTLMNQLSEAGLTADKKEWVPHVTIYRRAVWKKSVYP